MKSQCKIVTFNLILCYFDMQAVDLSTANVLKMLNDWQQQKSYSVTLVFAVITQLLIILDKHESTPSQDLKLN